MLQLKAKKKPLDLANQISNMKIEWRDIDDLKEDPRNVRTHTTEQIRQLASALKEFGWTSPIIVKDDLIIAGHARTRAAKLLNIKKVPVLNRSDMTDDQRRMYAIADNRLAELAGWDTSLLKDELAVLLNGNLDIQLTGFDTSFLDYKLKKEFVPDPDAAEDYTQVLRLSNTVDFPTEGEFEFPELRKDCIFDLSKIKAVSTWAGPGSELRDADLWFYNFNSDSQQRLDWKKVLLGFYVDDVRFECWWNDTPTYAGRMLKYGIQAALSPNYSTYFADSKSVHLYAIYRSRWVGRYMQEAGIKIVPDISCAPHTVEQVCAGLKGIKSIAFQAHQAYDKLGLQKKKEVIDFVMEQLKPETVLLYAPGDRIKLFPSLSKARIILVEPRGQVRQRRIKEAKST